MWTSKEKLNKLAKKIGHIERVKMMPCCVCGKAPPSDFHHVKGMQFGCGMGSKSSDFHGISLCKEHHQDGEEAFHNSDPHEWEEKFCTQEKHLRNVIRKLYDKSTEELGIQTTYENKGIYGSYLKNK